ncbi:saccharopine dehydrogenase [Campylobacter showae]|uniref:saccharopine dehydrogenase n=1 Tax=Campylobacter showae TaxID=204 RepID=UPI0028D66A9B|nr:saccharopine dehydrogenase [Campylobacter showae]
MKIVLANANPAVSRLATLALSKMGYEYVEIGDVGELSGVFDVLILDSDIDVKEANLKEFANKILYLSSKNSPTFEYADRILPKPFLPTEFITIVEDLASKTKSAEQPVTTSDETGEASSDGFKFVNDPTKEIIEKEIIDADIGGFGLDNQLVNVAQEVHGKDSAFDELSEIVKAIDDMDELSDKLEDDELNLDGLIDDEIMKFGELDEFDVAVKDNNFDEISSDLDADDKRVDVEFQIPDDPIFDATEFDAANGEEKLKGFDGGKLELDFDDRIEDIKSQIDEIDKMDDLSENLNADDEDLDIKFETREDSTFNITEFATVEGEKDLEVVEDLKETVADDKFAVDKLDEQEDIFASENMKFDEPSEQAVYVANSVLGDESSLEDMDLAGETEQIEFSGEENLTQHALDDELAEDIFAADEQGETEISSEQEEQEISEPEAMQNDLEIAQELQPGEYGDIDQISEKDMALALNESGLLDDEMVNLSSQKDQATSKMDELKVQISDAVAKNLENSLQDGELREALKNLNIKINISFEEK